VRPGTRVAARVPGASGLIWRFAAGTSPSKNLVVVAPGRGVVNASIELYYAFTLTWDATRRAVSLSDPR
jgi:hypothetical protein